MKTKIQIIVLLTMFLTLNVMASSSDASFKVALLGCEPIWNNQEKIVTVDSINQHKVDFTLFNGDTKSGSTSCEDKEIGSRVLNYFNRFDNPLLYSLGDNEWTDCHRTSNGAFDPVERLGYLRSIFFNKNTTQGNNPLHVTRQGDLGGKFSENSRLIKNGVMFVSLHISGSNNNLVATKKQCTKKSKRTQEDCNAATQEYKERNPENIKWLKDSFTLAGEKKLAGIVLSIQADIYFPFEMSDGGYQETFMTQLDPAKNGYTDFFNELVTQTHLFKGEVLLYHSDSHFFKMDKAMFDKNGDITKNFTRIEAFGDRETSWIEMTVDPKSETVFSFKPVILEALKSN